jgi:hypothetical protein
VAGVLSLALVLVACDDTDGPATDDSGIQETPMTTEETGTPSSGLPSARDAEVESRCPEVYASELVSPLTGAEAPARTDERWNIVGTDLGLSFEQDGKTYLVFGDTWGREGVEGADWRSNVMAVAEPDSSHGYILTDVIGDGDGQAKELLSSLRQPKTEYTVVPTAGIAVGSRMYLHYMSVRDWEEEWWGYKQPIVNGAGFAYSDDHGQTWVKDEGARWSGDTAFTQTAMVEEGGYVYVFGTPAGRFGPARLLRAPSDSLLDPGRYEYWSGDRWSPAVSDAAEVVPAPVGELSVRWSPYHKRWLMMYTNEVSHAIVLRTAERLEGPWDQERVVVTADEHPSLYAPFMLPQVTGPEVYFTMSVFEGVYNVFLMRMTLDCRQS